MCERQSVRDRITKGRVCERQRVRDRVTAAQLSAVYGPSTFGPQALNLLV